jgi:hypothetical protein
MTTSVDRQLENAYIAIYIEVTEAGFEIPFDSTLISNLRANKKIRIRRIYALIIPGGCSPYPL